MPLESRLAGHGGGSPFKEVWSIFMRITFSSFLGNICVGVLEKRVGWLNESFCCGHGTLDQVFVLSRISKCLWEFGQAVYMFFCRLREGIQLSPTWGSCRECFKVFGALLWAIQLPYHDSKKPQIHRVAH